MSTIDEIYFCPHTLEFYMKLSQKDKNKSVLFRNSKLYFIELIVFYYHAVLIVRSWLQIRKILRYNVF